MQPITLSTAYQAEEIHPNIESSIRFELMVCYYVFAERPFRPLRQLDIIWLESRNSLQPLIFFYLPVRQRTL